MPKVKWPQLGREVEVASGTTILDCALDHDIPLEHACGGFCACTTCHVHILEGASNVSTMEEMEDERIGSLSERKPESRLGCQTQIKGDVSLFIPDYKA